jgi:pimeloyl-ACP methyl ester carboxylesterase
VNKDENCIRIITLGLVVVAIIAALGSDLISQADARIEWVKSKEGTPIAVECAGAGPSLVIVHGGIGDHTRWKPLFPLFAPRFRVCAMDRRGHAMSGDSLGYTLQKETDDVAAVVNSRPGPIFLLGHSYGGICAMEAAFLSYKISRLVLYEPPLEDRNHDAVATKWRT